LPDAVSPWGVKSTTRGSDACSTAMVDQGVDGI